MTDLEKELILQDIKEELPKILYVGIDLLSGVLSAISLMFFADGDNMRALVMIAYAIYSRLFVLGRKGDG